MINLLANDVWNGAINVVVDIFMKIMDWMWALKLPGTNIPLFVIWVFGGVINVIFLLVNSSRGLSSVSRASLEASSSVAKGAKGVVSFSKKRYQNSNKQQVKREVKRQNVRQQAKDKRGVK
ncbi:hypothetical protein [Spiroplasma sp. ChiS]|uniref:hypothetical protein n=1 Tax=Spiroplasma sp. ChiS TaxID=2099885 RepID=UPI001F29EE17|nr:hypothetical protein [Spiroplasma sp. ChiS]